MCRGKKLSIKDEGEARRIRVMILIRGGGGLMKGDCEDAKA